MGVDKSLVQWIGDSLHDVLGYSDRNLAEYIGVLASKANSVDDLYAKLLAQDVPGSDQLRSFATELFGKLASSATSRQQQSTAASQRRAATNADLLRESSQYSMVSMDEPILPQLELDKKSSKKSKDKSRDKDREKSRDKDRKDKGK